MGLINSTANTIIGELKREVERKRKIIKNTKEKDSKAYYMYIGEKNALENVIKMLEKFHLHI